MHENLAQSPANVNLTWWYMTNTLEAEGSELQDYFWLNIKLKYSLGYMRLKLNKQTTLKCHEWGGQSGERTRYNHTRVRKCHDVIHYLILFLKVSFQMSCGDLLRVLDFRKLGLTQVIPSCVDLTLILCSGDLSGPAHC